MPDTDLSDIGDVLATRFAEIGIDPNSEAPLNLPSATAAEPVDLVQKTLEAGEQADAAPEPKPVEPAATAPVADATTTAAAQEPTASAPPAVMAYLREKYGEDFSSKYQSDEAFLQGVINLNKRIGQRDEDAQLGRLLKERPDQIAAKLVEHYPHLFPQPKAPEPQPAPQPQSDDEFSLDWLRSLQVKDGADPAVRQKIEQWVQNRALAASPVGKELQATKAELAKIKEMLAQGVPHQGSEVDFKLDALRQEQAAKEFLNANASWMFTEVNGVRALSPEGFVYREALAAAHQGGANFEMAKDYADAKLAAHRAKHAANGNGKATTTNPAIARQAAPAVPQPETSYDWQRDGEDLGESLYRNLKHFGLMEALGQS